MADNLTGFVPHEQMQRALSILKQVGTRLHRQRWQVRLDLTNLPCSMGNACDPNLTCTKAQSSVMLIGS